MGWGRMLLFGDLGQQLDIEEQRRQIHELKNQVRSESNRASQNVDLRLDILERNCDEIKLYMATLIRYLVAKGAVDVHEFGSLVDEIDAEDGSTDGRYKGNIL